MFSGQNGHVLRRANPAVSLSAVRGGTAHRGSCLHWLGLASYSEHTALPASARPGQPRARRVRAGVRWGVKRLRATWNGLSVEKDAVEPVLLYLALNKLPRAPDLPQGSCACV
jgi:hypothetical protein